MTDCNHIYWVGEVVDKDGELQATCTADTREKAEDTVLQYLERSGPNSMYRAYVHMATDWEEVTL